MAGRGPRPKDHSEHANPARARREAARMRVVVDETAPPPKLPRLMPDGDTWPAQTLKWWRVWINSPLTADYRESDWLDLLDCAVVHGRLWRGEMKAASELRLRMARHGATREDRARLRITFATAEQAEKKVQPKAGPSSRDRRRGLRVVSIAPEVEAVPEDEDGDPEESDDI